jgi:rubrerythrin
MEWDSEMLEMKEKLDKFLSENYIMYHREAGDYKAHPKSEGKPEGYDSWFQTYIEDLNNNTKFKKNYESREKRRKRNARRKEDAPILICKVCGYKTQTYFPGAFNQHHNENCRFKGDQ